MALPNFQRNDLQNNIADPTVFANVGSQIVIANILNRAARMVVGDVDLRSSIRIAGIGAGTDVYIYDDEFVYTAPVDLKEDAIIDVRPRGERALKSKVKLVTPEEFDRKKSSRNLQVAVLENSNVRKLLLDIDVTDVAKSISKFNGLNDGGGTWVVFGDGTNIVADTTNFKEGSGSLRFDLIGSGTTAGLENTAITSFNITSYKNTGFALAWIYINDTTNLTNFIIRLGSDSTNYYEMTVTNDTAGQAFVNGWNLIRWNFVSKTTTGTPVDTAIDYATVYMTKTSGKSDDGYRLDSLTLHLGINYEIEYYSRFPWQNASQVYLENSTQGTDYINAYGGEDFDLFVMRGKVELFRELRDYEQMKLAMDEYKDMVRKYKFQNPSRRLTLETEYFRLNT